MVGNLKDVAIRTAFYDGAYEGHQIFCGGIS